MRSVLRIIDANANRAREALRVMEEAARFVLDDAALSERLKRLRHELSQACGEVPGLQQHRDTPGDVGTQLHTEREAQRGSIADVVSAAGQRLSEALRAVEEYLKLTPHAQLAPRIEQLRYRGYELERRLNEALRHTQPRQWRLCVLLTESLCTRPWEQVLCEVVDAGADCVQVREKQMPGGALRQRVERVIELCRPRGVSVIVNDRLDVALAAGADGVHLGQRDLSCAEARRLAGRELLVGVSTSRIEQARAAHEQGADYCGVGPMFATTTVDDKPDVVGPAYLREYLQWDRLPHLAIGGITPANVGQLVEAGVRGVAVSSVVCQADRPGEAVRAMLTALSVRQ